LLKVAPARNPRTLAKAFGEGFLTNALNPKVAMFYIAAFPQFLPPGSSPAAAYSLVVVHALLNMLWFGPMVLLFERLSRVARSGKLQRWIKGITGVVFVGFGMKLATLRA
jgi:threonine/homoserine/homoserine lactone efflux protein